MATRYMDPDKVRAIAKGLETASNVLKAVDAILQAQMDILKATAFIGLVGGLAVERYLSIIQPQIQELANKTAEMSQDVNNSVNLWLQAQEQG